jgi:hypothetical protein
MAADTISARPAPERVVVEVKDSREIGPAEAEGLLRECLALTHKRLDAAIFRALETLQGEVPEDDEPAPAMAAGPKALDDSIAEAIRRKRTQVAPIVRARFDQAFQRRREGKTRARDERGPSPTLALVDHGDHSAQVTLRSAVKAMRDATLEEAFALDFRVRMLLREPPVAAGTFDNPWSSDYICDAYGGTCRELWPGDGLWRPIMERLAQATTPQVAALHRELNVLLQDRDVLPTLRVRTHSRGDDGLSPENLGGRALFDRLVQMIGPDGQSTPQSAPARPAPAPIEWGDSGPASVWPTHTRRSPGADWSAHQGALVWSALVNTLNSLQHGRSLPPGLPELAGVDREAMREGTANEVSAIRTALAGSGGSPADRATMDVVAGVLDYVFDDPYLPDPIKAVIGRLQIPMLKAALLDHRVVSDSQHPARRFFDTLAHASIDLDPASEKGRALIALATGLAQDIREGFEDDLRIFDAAKAQLDTFLDGERAEANQRLAEAVPPLIAQDERADARAEAQAALDARLAGRAVPAEVRAFLDHECAERLTTICLKSGPEGADWESELSTVDELLWSIAPKTSAAARKKLASQLPVLLRSIDRDWSADDDAQARRKALLSSLFELHLSSLRAPSEGAPAKAAPAPAIPAAPEPDEYDERVLGLVRGDWCEFKGDSGEPILARLAWRAPQRRRILFSHRDGSTAFVHTPESLAEAFRSGRAVLAVEAVPLFDRAMAQMVAQRSGEPARASAAAR